MCPNDAAAVVCSDSCSVGVLRSASCSGLSKFGGSDVKTLGAEDSVATRSLHAYHHAMSCGLTNETVVHHGSSLRSPSNHFANCFAICPSTRQPWPGAPFGDGNVP